MNGTVPMNEEGHEESQEPIHDSIPKNAPLPAPDAEVREKPARPMRQFTAIYKAFILRQAERCSSSYQQSPDNTPGMFAQTTPPMFAQTAPPMFARSAPPSLA